MRLNRSLACVLAGGLCLAASAVGIGVGLSTASAQEEPGSGLGVVSLVATSGGQRILTSTSTGQASDTGVPYAEAIIAGPRSAALASAAWPGGLAGNAGSLLAVLAGPGSSACWPNELDPAPPGVPKCTTLPITQEMADQYSLLNTPIRAEADNGSEHDETSAPGVRMVADASDFQATADALIGSSGKAGLGSFGTSRAVSTVAKTGVARAEAKADSETEDIALFPTLGSGGLITIDSVASEASAVTDGFTATATGRTVVTGMRVNNIPVTVDGTGVHSGDQDGDASPATEVVRSMLKQAHVTMFMTEPQSSYDKELNSVTYDAGTLVITQDESQFSFIFGGAKVTAASTKAFVFEPPDFGTGPLPPATGGGVTQPGFTGSAPGFTGGTGAGSVPTTPNLGEGGNGAPLPNTVPSANRAKLPEGLAVGWPIVAVLGAVLMAGGFRRLPDRLLDAPTSTCPLGDST